eukprot:c15452_g1_i2.p1 GENE.c15452_g1_i2~~c15452_g1_i2.p1  ORF type:complete len:440 (-),score=158.56 c15452_g1_i2:144-1463(-)
MSKKSVAVVVLGDIGRSPRMQYHAISLAKSGFNVSLVGYLDSELHPEIQNKSLAIHVYSLLSLGAASARGNIVLYILFAIFKVFATIFMLFFTLLFRIPSPSTILVQNPPSIPTLFVVWIVCRLRRCKFVIDWHNYGYSIVALSQKNSFLINFAKKYEETFGKLADDGICVSEAMQYDLKKRLNIDVSVMYDRPFTAHRKLSIPEKTEFFSRLWSQFSPINEIDDPDSVFLGPTSALFAGHSTNTLRTTAIVVSGTSWTADEDFSILLDAVVDCDKKIVSQSDKFQNKFPYILIIVTGKGPMKAEYEAKMRKLKLKNFGFATAWLTPVDYTTLLACADLGISLHTSSSGLDLPMKVIDMFSSATPVCSADFSCISELVKVNKNGLLFSGSSELSTQLLTVFSSFHSQQNLLTQLQTGAKASQKQGWDSEWKKKTLPLIY